MGISKSSLKAEGDQEALLYIVQIAVGVAAGLFVVSVVADRLLGELLGFVALCTAQYPFARRTWATEVPPGRYWMGVLIGTAVMAALRLLFE